MAAYKDLFNHRIRLHRLSLKDFRGVGNLELKFGEDASITVLIADNGGGKTSILDAAANFLRHFLAKGVLGSAYEKSVFGEAYQSLLNAKDIKNDQAVALCEIALKLTYKYPAKEVFEIVRDIAAYLNEYQLSGSKAMLRVQGETNEEEWVLFVDDQDKEKELPEDIIHRLDELTKPDENGNRRLRGEDEFEVASFVEGNWLPNMGLSSTDISKVDYTGELIIQHELNKSGSSPPMFPEQKAGNIEEFIGQLEAGIAFIEDFHESAKVYSSENTTTILPLLACYGGAAINTKFDKVSIRYEALPYQAYKGALEPGRFGFEDFFEWFNMLNEEPEHKIELVGKAILEVLNAGQEAGQEIYRYLRIEKGSLLVDKKAAENIEHLPIEVSQLSAGEKNLFALIGDLVKRAIQLNPALFEVDFDEDVGTYSNPLEYTYGVVLIDEIDLHLHPKWQRQIVPKLRKLFPKVQFVVTTHSPFVLQAVSPDQRIRLNNGQPEYFNDEPVSDYEATLIDYFMMTDFFDPDTEKQLKKFRELLVEVAQKKRNKKDPEFVKSIKELSKKGDVIKRVIAIELAQLNDKAD